MKFDRFKEISYALLDRHTEIKSKHFTFIVYKNKIVSIGFNNTKKTHPINLRNNYRCRDDKTDISDSVGTHSELAAIIKYGWEDLDNHVIVNTRINRLGQIANSRPCEGCQNLIKQMNVKAIYYTDADGNFVRF